MDPPPAPPLAAPTPKKQATASKGPPLQLTLAGGKAVLWAHLQLRDRFEIDGGRDFAAGKRREYITQRARLGLGARLFSRVEAYVELQDVRTWGEETNTLGDYAANGLDVHQAWAKVAILKGLGLQIGRMELAYDNERLLGAVDWTQQGRAFDAARLAFERGPWHAHLFYARVAEWKTVTWEDKGDQALVGLWAKWTRFAFVQPSVLFLADLDFADGVDRKRYTVGLRVHGAWKGLGYDLEYYHQLGSQGAMDINAFLVAGRVSYTAPVMTKPTVQLWVDLLSGDSDAADDKIQTFDTLFATNHKFYGFMDLFLAIPAHTGGKGLLDVGGRLQLTPWKNLQVMVDYHAFQIARSDAQGRKLLGHEIDVVAAWGIWKGVGLAVGYGVFLPTQAMSDLRNVGDESEHWFFLQTNVQF